MIRQALLSTGLSIAAAIAGCGDRPEAPPPDKPEVAAARATISESCFERTMHGYTHPNPKGAGTVVVFGNCAYLVRDGKVYAISDLARKCSPSIEVSKELRFSDLLPSS